MLDKETILQYVSLLGNKKMNSLWEEFKTDSNKKFEELDINSKESLRLTFHSLKSSSKIFGLEIFSNLCSEIEENILQQEPQETLFQQVKQAKLILQEHAVLVDKFFEKAPE